MISIKNVTFGYTKSSPIIKSFNLDIQKGDIIAITGKSGVGKTTLLRLICGLEKPDTGSINISNLKISFVPADCDLFPGFSALENVSIVSDKEKAECHLKALGLEENINECVDGFSTGMKKRVSLARALANNPNLLVLDEPFAPLDSATKEQVINHIKQLNFDYIIFATHDDEDIKNLGAKEISI